MYGCETKEGNMKDLSKMSTEELLRAIDYCVDTGTNLGTHGQADDYTVGSLKMAALYQAELERREAKKGKNNE